jgi:hypothetical protein
MRDISQPPPAIKYSQQQLQCVNCGARTHATCTCGMNYIPVTERVAKYDQDNPGKSTRQAAAELGVSKSEVHRARQAVPDGTPDTVTGSDGKQYPSRRYRRPSAPSPRPVIRQDLIDQAMTLIRRMRETDYDTWASFDRIYQKAREKLSENAF